MDNIAVGVIGCGFFSRNHLNSWRDLKAQGVDLVAVCDLDPQKAEAAARDFGIPHWYVDAASMLDNEKLGLVDIVTQMATHVPLVEMTLSRGIPTIVQKPFGRDIAEVRAMTDAAAKAGVFLAVHENFRFQAPLMRIKEIIDSGAIGSLNWGRVSFRTGWDIYAGQPYLRQEERFVLLDLGVHVLDVARYYFGEVQRLSAELQRRNPTVAGEDTATILCRHRSGAVSVVECTYETRKLPDPFPETMLEIEGDSGSIVLKPNYVIELTSNGERTVIDAEIEPLPWAERPWHVVQDSVRNTCRHMVDSLRANRPASTSAADNLRTFALVEAAYKAGTSATSA
jgi:predicted dehydrogenase